MEVTQVLHMNGGLGETSYANNSLLQRKVLTLTKAITEAAISEVYNNMAPMRSFCMAELGCSSGPNTFYVAAELVDIVHKLSLQRKHELPEFLIHLNDLPGNDFNSIFQSLLPMFQSELSHEIGQCFVSGVAGSFYGRLFAAKSLHFVHSSYSLMWLSRVPPGLEMNKENIYMASGSPKSVMDAYYEQFQSDFGTFLKCRSEEVVRGGRMVLTILGRKSEDASSKECCLIWELLALSLKQMVSKAVIKEEKVHSFNIPQYTPSPAEVKKEVEKEGSFAINCLEASEVPWAPHSDDGDDDHGYDVAKCMRSVAEPLLVGHFGEVVIDELFEKYRAIIYDRMSKGRVVFISVTVSLMRKE